ncbi:MAG: hypothetical protein ABWY49_01405, partial [Rhizobium sp.]
GEQREYQQLQIPGTELAAGAKATRRGEATLEAASAMPPTPASIATMIITHLSSFRKTQQKTYLTIV